MKSKILVLILITAFYSCNKDNDENQYYLKFKTQNKNYEIKRAFATIDNEFFNLDKNYTTIIGSSNDNSISILFNFKGTTIGKYNVLKDTMSMNITINGQGYASSNIPSGGDFTKLDFELVISKYDLTDSIISGSFKGKMRDFYNDTTQFITISNGLFNLKIFKYNPL